MAKEMTAADVLAFLASKGIENLDDLQAAAQNSVSDAAFHHLNEKVLAVPFTDEKNKPLPAGEQTARVEKWQQDLFDLAARMSFDFKSEVRNQRGRGTGQETVQQATIETPEGTLFVRLVNPVKK